MKLKLLRATLCFNSAIFHLPNSTIRRSDVDRKTMKKIQINMCLQWLLADETDDPKRGSGFAPTAGIRLFNDIGTK